MKLELASKIRPVAKCTFSLEQDWVLPKQQVERIDGRVLPTLGESQDLNNGEIVKCIKQVGTECITCSKLTPQRFAGSGNGTHTLLTTESRTFMRLFSAGTPSLSWQDGSAGAVCSVGIQVIAAAFAGLCLLATISNWLAQAVGERIAEYDMDIADAVEPRPAPHTAGFPTSVCPDCPPSLLIVGVHINEDPIPLQMH